MYFTDGWSALMWATTNNHENLVKLLLEHGASSQTKSSKGRTVFDFVKNDTHKIADMVFASSTTSNRDSISSTSSIAAGSNSSTSSNAGDNDRYYKYSTDEHYDSFIKHDNEYKPEFIEAYLRDRNEEEDEDEDYNYEEDDDDDDDDDDLFEERKERMIKPFDWDKCMPDQMFVFGAEKLPHILDSVITNTTLSIEKYQKFLGFLPANVIFLSARFAHYFSSAELAEDVMEGALHRISIAIKVKNKIKKVNNRLNSQLKDYLE